MRHLLFACLFVSLLGCKKSGDEPRSGSAAAAPTANKPPAPSTTGGTKWVPLQKLGFEVEAPACAEETEIMPDSESVTPKDPDCSVPFPGAVFIVGTTPVPATMKEQLDLVASDGRKPKVTRQDTLPTGWIVEWSAPASGDDAALYAAAARHTFGSHSVACMVSASKPEDLAVLSRLCTSVREKK